MRRSDRLFQIIQVLRRAARNPITAQQLANELEISVRTVYRDIADLMAQRVPIRGETGMGYVLESGYDMPPLMLTSEEVEAALLGAQWVANQGDSDLSIAARDLISKIGSVLPEEMQTIVMEPITMTPKMTDIKPDGIDMSALRTSIRNRYKVKINYTNLKQISSSRIIWPIAIAYFETIRLIVAWCEERNGFGHFRTDQITDCQLLDQKFHGPIAKLRKEWWEQEKSKHAP